MTQRALEVKNLISPSNTAKDIATKWDTWDKQRQGWLDEKVELRDYIFATDTSTTSNQDLPWKNSTTIPKLTQIRDNLHSNYISALFPNDEWLKWEAYSTEDNVKRKRRAIQAYMSNKTREGDIRSVASQLLYDYIDYGNAFATVKFEDRRKVDPETGDVIQGFVGPKLVRISPYDIVFDITANSFTDTPKIIRSIIHMSEMQRMVEQEPDNADLKEAFEKMRKARTVARGGSYTLEEFRKSSGYQNDGFGNILQYYQDDYVEVLQYEGDIWDQDNDTLHKNRLITVVDRAHVIRNEGIPTWLETNLFHVGWRSRPDNIWSMGPLDNLVGMQYRIDHLENLKADMYDQIAFPPLKIIGQVEEFVWGPGEEIHIDEGGDVQVMAPNSQALNADFQIQNMMNIMELMAGAPREAMGMRSPGEKTAFEVQQLQNASGRIFQEKITSFEIQLLEPALNSMLEVSRRNMDTVDVVRTMDDDIGVQKFMEVTRDDITAKGKLRPVGARHFAQQAQLLQNLNQLMSSQVGQLISQHMSKKELSKLVEDSLGLDRYSLFRDNVAIFENAEAQKLATAAQQDVNENALTPPLEE